MTKTTAKGTATNSKTAKDQRRVAAPAPASAPTLPSAIMAVTPAAKPPAKQTALAAMLIRDEGATLDQMVERTGWLPHTVRATLTGLKKKGYALSSEKADGTRTYRAVAPK